MLDRLCVSYADLPMLPTLASHADQADTMLNILTMPTMLTVPTMPTMPAMTTMLIILPSRYYAMLTNGDDDLLATSLLDTFARSLPLAKARTSHYFAEFNITDGAAFWPEYVG
jgi:hypothetical protein